MVAMWGIIRDKIIRNTMGRIKQALACTALRKNGYERESSMSGGAYP